MSASRPRAMLVYGTRPESIKMAPVVRQLAHATAIETTVVTTGQHREMVDAVNAHFGVAPDLDLGSMRRGQSLQSLSAALYERLLAVIARDRPNAVVVHGDTTSAALAAMAAYYAGVDVVHVEAGLRSGDLRAPFPEEGNRRVIGQLAALHLAPTAGARANLVRENVDPASIVVTGNTVIDAFRQTLEMPAPIGDPALRSAVDGPDRIVLVTMHRRESWGEPLLRIARALVAVAQARDDVRIVLALHPNPVVAEALVSVLGGHPQVVLCPPQEYPVFCRLVERAYCVVTDSGGVQEEAPSVGRPVLVLRDRTERPEAIAAGCARLVGTEESTVAAALGALLDDAHCYDAMARVANPYGDGHAAGRVVAALAEHLGVGARLPDFIPAAVTPAGMVS